MLLLQAPCCTQSNPAGVDDHTVPATVFLRKHEQILFLVHLYRNELPFKIEHQRLVKDIMIVEAGRNWILRAKTGWDG